jgi:hypothetical protein
VCHSLNTDDLAKARSRSDILEKADNELWAAMLLKGCPVNTIENTHIYSVLAIKATVSTTAFLGNRGLAIEAPDMSESGLRVPRRRYLSSFRARSDRPTPPEIR